MDIHLRNANNDSSRYTQKDSWGLNHYAQIRNEQSDGPKRWIGRFLMETLLATARSSVALRGDRLRSKFSTSDLLYWQAVIGVILAQFALCYGAMTCRGYPPMTENEIYQMLASPLVVWVPATFGSRVNRLRGIMIMSLALTILLSMVYVNGDIRPSVGSHSGPLGILKAYFVQILFLTAFFTPIAFFALYHFERVTGDVWRMICLRNTEDLSFSETWAHAWGQTQKAKIT
jgi:hypothetical protein